MHKSCLFQNLAIVVVVFTPTALTFASPSTSPNPAPQLIVWAHTNLENQGAPTLDILDLERYFVARLERRIENIRSSQTARRSNLTSPNAYLAELSVIAITPSIRAVQNPDTRQYKEDPVFYVELSLSVKQPAFGRPLGFVREAHDYHLGAFDLERLEPKRAALYKSADTLADRFADGIANGEFGGDLKLLCLPGIIDLVKLVLVLGAAVFVGGIAVKMMATRRTAVLPEPSGPPESEIKRLNDAIALSIATDNFSQEKLWDAAHDALEQTLDRAASIQQAEAARRANAKVRAAEDAKLASYAAATGDFTKEEVIAILRKADEWDYRLLREAQQQDERSVTDETH